MMRLTLYYWLVGIHRKFYSHFKNYWIDAIKIALLFQI